MYASPRPAASSRTASCSRCGSASGGCSPCPRASSTSTGPSAALRGTFTVLADGGMDDEEIVRWLHTPDPTLPVPGHPLDAIRAGFKTEVRRRAMEEAF